MLWLAIFVGIVLLFGLTAFRGAPYVPTHRRAVERALDLLELKPGDVVVDLGSGDGVFLKAAARRGLRAYGYEINPILCLVAWLRCWRYRRLVTVRLRDFWSTTLPQGTRAVFVFGAGPFMKRLSEKLGREAKGMQVVSYAFDIPGHTKVASLDGVNLYRF